MTVANVTPAEVEKRIASGAEFTVLDVRTFPEYAAYHIANALLMPIYTLPSRIGELDRDADIVVVCEHGIRSASAAKWLAHEGFTRISNMLGGMAEWDGEVEVAE
jgi:rhodanese-related sulfurtransferase